METLTDLGLKESHKRDYSLFSNRLRGDALE